MVEQGESSQGASPLGKRKQGRPRILGVRLACAPELSQRRSAGVPGDTCRRPEMITRPKTKTGMECNDGGGEIANGRVRS